MSEPDEGPRPADAPPRAVPRRVFMPYLWAVGLAMFALVVWYVGWRDIRDQAASMRLELFAGMMLCETAGVWLRAFKWRLALGPGQGAVGLFFVSKGAGNLSPGRVGELSPLLLPGRRSARLGAWIVLDRLLESSVTLTLGMIGFLALDANPRWLAAIAATFVLLVALPLAALTRGNLLARIAAWSRPGSLLCRAARLGVTLSDAIRALRRRVPAAVLITIAAGFLELTGGVLLYRSFGQSITVFMAAAGKCANGLVGAVPFTPAPTGIPHMATGVVLHELGGVPVDVLAAAVALHVVAVTLLFWSSFAVGMLFLRRPTDTP